MTQLFLSKKHIVKTAAAKKLVNGPDSWSTEILAELFSKHPYLGKHQVDFQIKSQEPEQKYMFGYFLVTQKPIVPDLDPSATTARTVAASDENDSKSPSGPPSIRIPVIVEQGNLYPFDVMIDSNGTFMPLNERRASQILLNTQPAMPHSVQGYGLLYASPMSEFMPPLRGGGPQFGTNTKLGSLCASAVQQDPTLKAKVASALRDPEVGRYLSESPALCEVLLAAGSAQPEVELPRANPDAYVVEKTASGARLTAVWADGFQKQTIDLDRSELSNLPEEDVAAVMRHGVALRVRDGASEESLNFEYPVVKSAGRFSIVLEDGTPTYGYVVPEVVHLDGSKAPGAVLFNETGASYQQEKVAGSYLDELIPGNLSISASPHGRGVFAKVTDAGIEQVTVPVKIAHQIRSSDGLAFQTEGGQVIKVASYINAPVKGATGAFYVPDDWAFIPANNGLKTAPAEMSKTAALRPFQENKVEIRCDTDRFYIAGGCGIQKLAAADTKHLTGTQAAILLGAIGLDTETIMQKLANANCNGSDYAYGNRKVSPKKEKKKISNQKVASFIQALRPHQYVDLIKTASLLNSPTAVDAILSLGMITPDTVQTFIESIPQLEEALTTCARLVIMSRLGQADVPESAALKGMQGLDDIIRGLQSLQARLEEENSQQVTV